MNILAIGNSFSEDATRYLYGIARADGVKINVFNLCIGGCSLDRHYRNMLSDARVYELQCNGHKTEFYVSLSEALTNREWDIITIQQVSHLGVFKESFKPYAHAFADFLRKYAPKAKIYLHQTWGYEDNSQRLNHEMKYDSYKAMQSDLTRVYQEVAKEIGADGIIRSGEMFEKLIDCGVTKVHRDTSHASLGIGRYALALLWYKTLIGGSVKDNVFSDFDEEILATVAKKIRQTVDSFI